jgi:general secretion pathway protein G
MVRVIARGFTLIELLVVMAIIALLLAIAVPRYHHSVERAKEAVLREDLALMRDAIDKYYADRGQYPETIAEIAEHKYLRSIPKDPITDSSSTWLAVAPAETERGRVYDVRSGAAGMARDGSPYASW